MPGSDIKELDELRTDSTMSKLTWHPDSKGPGEAGPGKLLEHSSLLLALHQELWERFRQNLQTY